MSDYTVFTCEEYSEVEIPIHELITDGQIDVFPEISECGLFDIDYRRRELRLVSKGFVGLIPLNKRVALRVTPRFPIRNVFYLLQKSDRSVKHLPNFLRSYQVEEGYYDRMDYIIGEHFVESLYLISQEGVKKKYLHHDEEGSFRGRILFGKTINRAFARNMKYRQHRQVYTLTENTPENRLIHKQLIRLKDVILGSPQSKLLLPKLGSLIDNYSRVGFPLSTDSPYRLIDALHEDRFSAPHYRAVLWLAFLLETKRGISITSFGSTNLSSMLVNMADVFESYIRELIRSHFCNVAGSLVSDGNISPTPLFKRQNIYFVKPDIHVKLEEVGGLIIDAKYKPKRSTADRYEVLAFCEALQAKCAIIVAPMTPDSDGRKKLVGETRQGVMFYELLVDLGQADMGAEETLFLTGLTEIIAECYGSVLAS